MINSSTTYRLLIFIFVGLMTSLSAVLDLFFTPCMAESPRNYTYRCSLAIMVVFTFLRVPNWLKLLVSLVSLSFYFLIIYGFIGEAVGTVSGVQGSRLPQLFFSTESFGYDLWTEKSGTYQSHFIFLLGIFVFFWLL